VQAQGGILTPRDQPFLLVVTGKAGRRHGYDDFWDDAGVLNYFGAGQYGPMEWTSPNRQLRDHAELGKDVHVFEEVTGGLRYRGQFASAGYYERQNVPDTQGNPRRAFVFLLVPVEDVSSDRLTEEDAQLDALGADWTMPLEDLRQRTTATLGQQPKSRIAKRRVWERSRRLKVYVRRRAGGKCEGCGTPAPFVDTHGHPYLEPHHTRRLTDGGPDDFNHVIALCPTCHRRVHHGQSGSEYNVQLKQKLQTIEAPHSGSAAA
jgi:5-methylcytosine-specific restriction enzyme A